MSNDGMVCPFQQEMNRAELLHHMVDVHGLDATQLTVHDLRNLRSLHMAQHVSLATSVPHMTPHAHRAAD
jgi:hypothetical protein